MTKDDEIKALRELLASVINDYDKTVSQMGIPRGQTALMYPLPPSAHVGDPRVEWLESMHTLHNEIEVLYVVTGFRLTHIYHDCEIASVEGETLEQAIDHAMSLKWEPCKRT